MRCYPGWDVWETCGDLSKLSLWWWEGEDDLGVTNTTLVGEAMSRHDTSLGKQVPKEKQLKRAEHWALRDIGGKSAWSWCGARTWASIQLWGNASSMGNQCFQGYYGVLRYTVDLLHVINIFGSKCRIVNETNIQRRRRTAMEKTTRERERAFKSLLL